MLDDFWPSLLLYANTVSIRASCGMAGAIVLVMALPPRNANNRLDFNQLLQRVFAGAFLPVFMGPWALAILSKQFPYLLLHEYPELIFFTLGSISYFLFRAIALWLYKNRDKAIDEMGLARRFKEGEK
ncbi:MAG: hypothetical protein ABL903_08460 [Methylococcales bacterium]